MSCCNKNYCIQDVQITSYTPVSVVGGNFICATNFSFSNAQNGDKFNLIFSSNIPSQTIIGPVVLTDPGKPAVVSIETGCHPDNLISDQLVNVSRLCCVYGSNAARLRILKAFDVCGREICLRKSASFSTIENIPSASNLAEAGGE